MDTDPLYMRTEEAAMVAGLPSAQALRRFVRRWNERHPESPIRRIRGRVERASLLRALSMAADLFTGAAHPGQSVPAARRTMPPRHMRRKTVCDHDRAECPVQLDIGQMLRKQPTKADDATD